MCRKDSAKTVYHALVYFNREMSHFLSHLPKIRGSRPLECLSGGQIEIILLYSFVTIVTILLPAAFSAAAPERKFDRYEKTSFQRSVRCFAGSVAERNGPGLHLFRHADGRGGRRGNPCTAHHPRHYAGCPGAGGRPHRAQRPPPQARRWRSPSTAKPPTPISCWWTNRASTKPPRIPCAARAPCPPCCPAPGPPC